MTPDPDPDPPTPVPTVACAIKIDATHLVDNDLGITGQITYTAPGETTPVVVSSIARVEGTNQPFVLAPFYVPVGSTVNVSGSVIENGVPIDNVVFSEYFTGPAILTSGGKAYKTGTEPYDVVQEVTDPGVVIDGWLGYCHYTYQP